MTSRRDILKYFAAGTVITPLAASVPAARLIEPPKVEIIKPPKYGLVEMPTDFRKLTKVELTLTFSDGNKRTECYLPGPTPSMEEITVEAAYAVSPYSTVTLIRMRDERVR